MSSTRFEAVLKPETALRQAVLLSACAALLTGIAVLLRLPFSPWLTACLTVLWIVWTTREIASLARGHRRVRLIRVGRDCNTVTDRGGRQIPVQIMSGSVVLPKLAWLRMRFADGTVGSELLRGDAAENEDWRRLQVLWRLGPRFFGRPAEADTITDPKPRSHFRTKTP